MEAVKIGKRGTVLVPAGLQKRYGFGRATMLTGQARDQGLLIPAAVVIPGGKIHSGT